MLLLSQPSNVGRLELTVDEDTRRVSDTRFFPIDSQDWVDLSFLDDTLRSAIALRNWGLLHDALDRNRLPLDMYAVVYDHIDDWGSVPANMDGARKVHIKLLITELAQRALAFSDSLINLYGRYWEDSTKNTPQANQVDVFSLLRDSLRLEYGKHSGVSIATRTDKGYIAVTAYSYYDEVTDTFPSANHINEETVLEMLRRVGAGEEASQHIAAAVNRMALIDPGRFRYPRGGYARLGERVPLPEGYYGLQKRGNG